MRIESDRYSQVVGKPAPRSFPDRSVEESTLIKQYSDKDTLRNESMYNPQAFAMESFVSPKNLGKASQQSRVPLSKVQATSPQKSKLKVVNSDDEDEIPIGKNAGSDASLEEDPDHWTDSQNQDEKDPKAKFSNNTDKKQSDKATKETKDQKNNFWEDYDFSQHKSKTPVVKASNNPYESKQYLKSQTEGASGSGHKNLLVSQDNYGGMHASMQRSDNMPLAGSKMYNDSYAENKKTIDNLGFESHVFNFDKNKDQAMTQTKKVHKNNFMDTGSRANISGLTVTESLAYSKSGFVDNKQPASNIFSKKETPKPQIEYLQAADFGQEEPEQEDEFDDFLDDIPDTTNEEEIPRKSHDTRQSLKPEHPIKLYKDPNPKPSGLDYTIKPRQTPAQSKAPVQEFDEFDDDFEF